MKKLALALVCLVSVAFFASCTPEGDPTIQVLNEEGYVQNGDVVNINTDFNFGFVMASSAETGKELASLILKIDDEDPDTITLTGTEYTYRGTLRYEITRDEIVKESTITAIVTDAAGKTATATLNLSINNPAQELVATPIEWVKTGHNVQDLSAYGLLWKETNYKEPFTHIFPADGCMLFACSGYGDDFDNIKTDLDLAAYFNNLSEMAILPESINTAEYNKVDCNPANKDYNDLLITKDADGNFHAILIKHATVGYTTATVITITGEAK
jgi:hypothetical protein